jgi:hypothetical protein
MGPFLIRENLFSVFYLKMAEKNRRFYQIMYVSLSLKRLKINVNLHSCDDVATTTAQSETTRKQQLR